MHLFPVAAKETVNKGYEEEKFHARRGHGFAAERANHLNDKLHGRDARIVGDDNAKDGADPCGPPFSTERPGPSWPSAASGRI